MPFRSPISYTMDAYFSDPFDFGYGPSSESDGKLDSSGAQQECTLGTSPHQWQTKKFRVNPFIDRHDIMGTTRHDNDQGSCVETTHNTRCHRCYYVNEVAPTVEGKHARCSREPHGWAPYWVRAQEQQ